ncbi:MAG: hypothetical protein IT378_01035 [Sandaracinaceae bacterium]|nr:hypothetical protein [Sandaracinaceae bacterium]
MLAVVEAAYRLDQPTRAWLSEIVEAAGGLLDHGMGVFGFVCRRTARGTLRVTSDIVTAGDVPAGFVGLMAGITEAWSGEVMSAFMARVLDTASEAHAKQGLLLADSPIFRPAIELGVRDSVAAKAVDPSGNGLVLGALLPRERTTRASDRTRWAQLMAHLLAGLRLRAGLRTDEGDAVVEPGGRVVHAEGEARSARDALREAAVAIDRARVRGRRDPDAALSAWLALVRGRWSLVDRFDRDGRRFLVARRNDPAVSGPAEISLRERQILAYAALGYSNKRIAYSLGLAPSTVSSHLRRGMRALGITERAALVELYRARAPVAEPS